MVTRPLEIVDSPPGTTLWRIHGATRGPLWFGPAPGRLPSGRFDAPNGEYQICYFSRSREGAFAEVFLRAPPVEVIPLAEVDVRLITSVQVTRPLRLAVLHGPGLARAGVTGTLTTGADYGSSRQLALDIWSRPDPPDGLEYRSRHDDGELSVALFGQARTALAVASSVPLATDRRWLSGLATRYGFEFTV